MDKQGTIVTFYSYKGGVGRSMALANVAVLLAQWGYKCLAIDWDLEAPGLENCLSQYSDFARGQSTRGVLDLFAAANSTANMASIEAEWKNYLTPLSPKQEKYRLDFLSAGRKDASYFRRLREFDLTKYYRENQGGEFIEKLRNLWKCEYDFILIDSRTGLTDQGGLCTIQMPDILLMLFTPTEQGLVGTLDIAERVLAARQKLSWDRPNLPRVPIPSRFDSSEHILYTNWLSRAAEQFSGMTRDWLPRDLKLIEFFEATKIPYKSYYSFGEKLAVLEESVADPGSLAYSYSTLAALIAKKLEDTDLLKSRRDEYVRGVVRSDYSQNVQIFGPRKRVDATLFVSYSPFGIDAEDAHLRSLLELLQKEINIQMGADVDFHFDFKNSSRIEAWRKWEEGSLGDLAILVPIITPGFFNDELCRKEIQTFVVQEDTAPRNSAILPMYYIHTPEARPYYTFPSNKDLGSIVSTHHLYDWSKLRFEPLESSETKWGIVEFASQVRDTVNPPPMEDRASDAIRAGGARFIEETAKRKITLPSHGTWEVAFVISGNLLQYAANTDFLNLLAHVPRYTGWPLWVDSRKFDRIEDRPFVSMLAWEAYLAIQEIDQLSHLDFWRIEPNGRFYHGRALEDDVSPSSNRPAPMTELDFGLPIWRIAEAIALGIDQAKQMKCILNHTLLSFAFRWSGLINRKITSWAMPRRLMLPRMSQQDEIISFVTVPLNTKLRDIHMYVYKALKPLYNSFDGWDIVPQIVEELTADALKPK
ncbi:MAG: AAA family ATPase [Ignavibacteriales bacterium]|nr:AAA family ATPase [Ignavibacteriales bacterium]